MWVRGLGRLSVLQWNWSRNESNAQPCRGILFPFERREEGRIYVGAEPFVFSDGMERIWSLRANTRSTHLLCCSLGSYSEFVVTSVSKDSLADSSCPSDTNCWSWSKITLVIFCFLGICADIFSANTSVCVPFQGREARETWIKMHSCSLLLLSTSVSVVVQNKGFEGPYDLCEVPLLLPDCLWGMTTLLIIWVGGPNPLLCGTSGLLVKKAESPLFRWHLLLCLAIYFLPILLMLVFVQTHGETD